MKLLALATTYIGLISAQSAASPAAIDMRNHIAPSPDGTQMVYHARGKEMKPTLFRADLNGKAERLLYGTPDTIEQEPRWSPDGKLIAFVSGTGYENGQLQLAIVEPDGSGFRRLTSFSTGMVKGPSWSPDSSHILFEVRNAKAGESSLHIYDLKENSVRKFPATSTGMLVQAEWSPDGKAVLVAERNPKQQGKSDLCVISLKHPDHRRRITNTPAGETMPVWHPSGASITYSRPDPETGSHELFSYDFEHNVETRLTRTPGKHEFFPIFSSDGKTLHFEVFEQSEAGARSTFVQMPFDSIGQH